MIRKVLIAGCIGFFTPMLANAVDLQVVFEGDCPVEVIDHSDSCGNGNTSNYACADNGAAVRWAPGAQIGSIEEKSDTGGLHNCGPIGGGRYQCIVRGNSGTEIEYDVISVSGCGMDPVIRIR